MALSLIINWRSGNPLAPRRKKADKQVLRKGTARLQTELVKLQYWVKQGFTSSNYFEDEMQVKVVRLSGLQNTLNPRGCRVVALGTPSDVENAMVPPTLRSSSPAAGEIVLTGVGGTTVGV